MWLQIDVIVMQQVRSLLACCEVTFLTGTKGNAELHEQYPNKSTNNVKFTVFLKQKRNLQTN